MPRATKEWIGATPDSKVPDRVKLRVWRRQCGDSNFAICPLSKLPIQATDEKHLDHIKALILQGEHKESNLIFVHVSAHREKTSGEVAIKASNDARAKAHLGIKGDGKTALAGRPDDVKKLAKAPKRPPVERKRGLYADIVTGRAS